MSPARAAPVACRPSLALPQAIPQQAHALLPPSRTRSATPPMLELARPLYLLLLLLLPLLAWWHLRQRRAAVPHPGLSLFTSLPVGRARLARHGGLALRLAGL